MEFTVGGTKQQRTDILRYSCEEVRENMQRNWLHKGVVSR